MRKIATKPSGHLPLSSNAQNTNKVDWGRRSLTVPSGQPLFSTYPAAPNVPHTPWKPEANEVGPSKPDAEKTWPARPKDVIVVGCRMANLSAKKKAKRKRPVPCEFAYSKRVCYSRHAGAEETAVVSFYIHTPTHTHHIQQPTHTLHDIYRVAHHPEKKENKRELFHWRAHADEHIQLRKLGTLVARKRASSLNSVTL